MAKDNHRLQFIMDLVDKVSAPSEKVKKSIQGMGKDVNDTQKKMAALHKQAGDISKLAALRGEIERGGKASAAQQREVDRLTRSLSKAGLDVNKLGDAERQTRIQIANTNTTLKQQQRELGVAADKQAKLTKAKEAYAKAEAQAGKMAATGGKMMLAGAALTGGIAAAGSPNYGFQKQMSAVQAIGDFSEQDKARLTASARAEAKVSSFGAVDAGQAQAYLAAAGFSVEKIEQSLKGVLDLAAATDTGLAEAADISSNILSGFDLGADQMGRMGDILTATTSGHNVNLQMLGDSMKYVAPIAKQTYQSAESIAAMVGLLGDVGIQGTMAGTALKGAMLRLAGPTRDAQKAFDKLGVSTKDVNGNVRSMPDVLEELQTKMKGMGSGDKLALLKRMFGEEPAAAIATLLDKAGDTIAEKTKRLENSAGAADRSARNRLNNLWGDVENFKSSMEDAQIQFGGQLDKMMRGIVRISTKAVDAVNNWMQENPKLARTVTLVAGALGVLMTASGAVIVALGSLWLIMAKGRLAMTLLRWAFMGNVKAMALWTASALKTVVVTTAQVAWWAISKTALLAWNATLLAGRVAMLAWNAVCAAGAVAMRALSFAMSMNPIGLLIVAIGALVAAGVWLYQNWERLPEIFSNLWAKVKEFVSFDPMAAITGAWDAVGEYFSNLFSGIWDSFMGTFSKIGDKLSSFGDWATGGFGMFDDEVKEQVTDAPKVGSDPVVNGKPPVKGGQVKPVAPVSNTYKTDANITINVPAGMDAKAVATEVNKQLNERDRRLQQQNRARIKD